MGGETGFAMQLHCDEAKYLQPGIQQPTMGNKRESIES